MSHTPTPRANPSFHTYNTLQVRRYIESSGKLSFLSFGSWWWWVLYCNSSLQLQEKKEKEPPTQPKLTTPIIKRSNFGRSSVLKFGFWWRIRYGQERSELSCCFFNGGVIVERSMSFKSRGGGGGGDVSSRSMVSKEWTFLFCLGSFCAGLLFTNRMWTMPEAKEIIRKTGIGEDKMKLVAGDCNLKSISEKQVLKDIIGEIPKTQQTIQKLDKTISNLEMELAAARATQESVLNGSPLAGNAKISESSGRRKYLMVVGINTAFSSRKRRDSVRATWLPQGEKRKKLEEEKGIIIRFVIGHSATSGGILDKAIEAEDKKHGDFMRLDHVEGYLELSAKTKIYFATAVSLWDAEFYIKVDDDVHVNIATLGTTLAGHRSKPRVYIGCMKSGPVLAQKGVRYHEPEYWKFGEEGNKYFRHATGQLYAISKDLATYIYTNQHMLHMYANEDVSLGAWFIGLDVQHIDDRKLCCGTPPDCEWKAQAGNLCVASFDWSCSGICNSAEKIKEVHRRCGEGEKTLWNAVF